MNNEPTWEELVRPDMEAIGHMIAIGNKTGLLPELIHALTSIHCKDCVTTVNAALASWDLPEYTGE